MTYFFRAMLLGYTALYAIGFWLPFVDSGHYSIEWQALLLRDGDGAAISYPGWVDYVIYAITVAVSAMLFFFVRVARGAFLFLTIAYTIAPLAWGLRVTTPLEELIWGLVNMMNGGLLAMLYLTSVAERFKPSAAQQGVPGDVAASRRRA